MSTRAVTEALFRRIAGGEPAEIAELYAERVDWRLSWPANEHDSTIPWIRHRATRADVEDHYRSLGEHHLPGAATADISAIVVDGADAVVLGELGQTLRATGVSYRAGFALHLTVSEGRITRQHIIEDSLAVHRAFTARRTPEG